MKLFRTCIINILLLACLTSSWTCLGQSVSVEWDELPENHQLYPRNLTTNLADVRWKGQLIHPTQADSLVLYTQDSRGEEYASEVPFNDKGDFEYKSTISAGLHSYHFTLTYYRAGIATELFQVNDIVAGDAYLIYGQSNAQAGRSRSDLSPYIRSFNRKKVNGDTVFRWEARTDNQDNHLFIDVLPGDIGQRFAQRIIKNHGIPVAIINGAVGGQIIDDLIPFDSLQITKNTMYKDWNTRVKLAGLSNHVRAIFWHQGESDGLPYNCRTLDHYKNSFSIMKNAWDKDFPNVERIYMFQSQVCTAYGILPECMIQIQEAQRQIAKENEQISILATGHYRQLPDGCHYPTEQYQQMGDDLFKLVNYHLYDGQHTPPSHLDVENASFANAERTKVSLRLNHSATEIKKEQLADLRFENDSVTQVVDIKIVEENQLLLTLSGSPTTDIAGLTHMSNTKGGVPLITNEATSLLHFYDQTIIPFHLNRQTYIPTYITFGPNPLDDELTLWWNLNTPLSYQLFNQDGQNLEKGMVPNGPSSISFRKHHTGIYFLRLTDPTTGVQHTVKLQKQ